MKTNRLTIQILVSLLASTLIVVSGCKGKKDAKQTEETPTVDVAQAVTDSIVLHKTYPGFVSSHEMADVVARVSGVVQSKNYTSGSYVEKGQVLFTIEPTKYRDAVTQAEASLATAQSQYEYYTRQHAAMKKAFESDAVSEMDVIQSENNRRQAEASIKNARAALATARLNLSYCTVRAPISGLCTSATVDPGNFVNGEGGSFKLAEIYDNKHMVVVFDIEESQYEKMVGANGGPKGPLYRAVPLSFNERLPHRYTADLYYEAPNVDRSTGTMPLKGTVMNVNNELRDGMYCTVSLPYGVDPKAILVKDASVCTDQLGKYLYVVNDSNKVVYTPIEVGDVYADTLRIVTKGLKPGAKYVTKAMLNVRNGMEIKPRLVK